MTEDYVDDALRRAWVAQPAPSKLPSLDTLKRKARRSRLQFAIRNGVEYLAVLSVVVMAGVRTFAAETLLMRFGNLLLMAGMLYLMAQLHARASARRPPEGGTATDYLRFLRIELARQAQALQTVWRWYLLPFVPGMLVINLAGALEDPGSPWLATIGAFIVILVAAHFLNRAAAARLARRLANLEAAVRDDEVMPQGHERTLPDHDPGGRPDPS
jgi:hypothetical protein